MIVSADLGLYGIRVFVHIAHYKSCFMRNVFFVEYANSKDLDQPTKPQTLVRIFINVYHSLANSAGNNLILDIFFFSKNTGYFIQIVGIGDTLQEISKPVF